MNFLLICTYIAYNHERGIVVQIIKSLTQNLLDNFEKGKKKKDSNFV